MDRAFVADPAIAAEELATADDLFSPGAARRRRRARRGRAGPRGRRSTRVRSEPGWPAFRPDPHRIAEVAVIAGVTYVDDSKATNPHAALASLSAYPHVVWVAGGLAKGADFADLVARLPRRGCAPSVLIGRDRAVIRDALARHAPEVPVVELVSTDTDVMEDVVSGGRPLGGAR